MCVCVFVAAAAATAAAAAVVNVRLLTKGFILINIKWLDDDKDDDEMEENEKRKQWAHASSPLTPRDHNIGKTEMRINGEKLNPFQCQSSFQSQSGKSH